MSKTIHKPLIKTEILLIYFDLYYYNKPLFISLLSFQNELILHTLDTYSFKFYQYKELC